MVWYKPCHVMNYNTTVFGDYLVTGTQ